MYFQFILGHNRVHRTVPKIRPTPCQIAWGHGRFEVGAAGRKDSQNLTKNKRKSTTIEQNVMDPASFWDVLRHPANYTNTKILSRITRMNKSPFTTGEIRLIRQACLVD